MKTRLTTYLRELWYAIRTSERVALECRWCHATGTQPCPADCPRSEESQLTTKAELPQES